MNQIPIQELITACKQGNSKAFEQLVVRFQPLVFRLAFRLLCNSQEAEDVVQETFIRIWLNIERYDSRNRFSTWIYTIASNLCYDKLRSASQQAKHIQEQHINNPILKNEIETNIINQEIKELIMQFTEGLTPKQKIVFILRDIEDLESQEVETITGLSAKKIKSNLYLARQYIKDQLSKIM